MRGQLRTPGKAPPVPGGWVSPRARLDAMAEVKFTCLRCGCGRKLR